MMTCRLGEGESLRLFEEVDAQELYSVITANRAYLSRWLPWAPRQTLDRTTSFIRASRKQLADNQGLQAAIVKQNRIVGVIGYHRIDWENRSTTIGYWLAESAQRAGTMTRAVTALVDHAFGTWKLNRVEIHAGTGNERSRAIPERLGFTREGVLRQAELLGSGYVDHVVYAMLAEEWGAARGEAGSPRDVARLGAMRAGA